MKVIQLPNELPKVHAICDCGHDQFFMVMDDPDGTVIGVQCCECGEYESVNDSDDDFDIECDVEIDE